MVTNFQGAAWQLIERLHRMNSTVGLPILERTLVLCSEHFEDPDTVAQVRHFIAFLIYW